MTLTALDGQSLTSEDLAFFNAHPHLARLAVKSQRLERDPVLTEGQRQTALLLWACELLNLESLCDDRRWAAWAKRRTEHIEGERTQ